MAYQTLYRKYRPKSFDMVYGQKVIVQTLKNIIKNNKLSHAYLFTGPRGTGKTSCAKLFAKAINCLNKKNGDACNKCDNCKTFNENSNPDIIEMDAASNNGVDEIREIKNKINLVPAISKYKIYIIDEVHMLSIGAFNALLKTLEEPPEYVIFILATTDPQKIPATIISRCQRFDFKNISEEQMKLCLKNIIEKEKISIEDAALDEIIKVSNGGMRDAIGLLDQSSVFCDDIIKKEEIQELSGSVSDSEIENLISYIKKKKYKEVIEKIRKWLELGKDFNLICQKMIKFVRDGIIYKKINVGSKDDEKKYDIFSEKILYYIFNNLISLEKKLQNTSQKELIFEIYLIKLMNDLSEYVSRETLQEKKNIDQRDKVNVPRGTLKKDNNVLEDYLLELKNIRINNIILNSSRRELEKMKKNWKKIEEFLSDFEYKKIAGILIEGNVVAASTEGIIVTFPTSTFLNKIEKNYDESIILLEKIIGKYYKVVYIQEEYWFKNRPKYIDMVKNKSLEFKDEVYILSKIEKIKNNSSFNDFSDLIEMEEK